MENTREQLKKLFDDSLKEIPSFKKKFYEGAFQALYNEHKSFLEDMSVMCGEEEEHLNEQTEKLANVIPDYAIEKLRMVTARNKRKNLTMDFNLCMAVYVIPLLTYTTHSKKCGCDLFAERIVEIWNAKNVTGLKLSKSSFDAIRGGFKKGLCYITTAVCESRNLPDDCYELETLRSYRDDYLMQTEDGRNLVEEYYNVAPVIVMAIDMHKDSSDIYERIYQEYLVPCIQDAECGRKEECKRRYMDMVNELENTYLM